MPLLFVMSNSCSDTKSDSPHILIPHLIELFSENSLLQIQKRKAGHRDHGTTYGLRETGTADCGSSFILFRNCTETGGIYQGQIHSHHAWRIRNCHLRNLGDIYRTFCRDTGCSDCNFCSSDTGDRCGRTEYLYPSDHQAGRKRRVGVEVVWH